MRHQDDIAHIVTLMIDSSVWQQFLIAFSLVLVLEGIIPFLYPGRWRRMVVQIATMDDRTMRIVGLLSMLCGVGLLIIVT
ncbi:MAG: hypothetical protein ACJA1U_001117 [Bermanella sp.]|jgi:uncharacterized protein YjeT (DUF2065 family)